MSNILECFGFTLVVAFLWFVWPPLVLLGAGLLLVLWANVRGPRASRPKGTSADTSATKAERPGLRRAS